MYTQARGALFPGRRLQALVWGHWEFSVFVHPILGFRPFSGSNLKPMKLANTLCSFATLILHRGPVFGTVLPAATDDDVVFKCFHGELVALTPFSKLIVGCSKLTGFFH